MHNKASKNRALRAQDSQQVARLCWRRYSNDCFVEEAVGRFSPGRKAAPGRKSPLAIINSKEFFRLLSPNFERPASQEISSLLVGFVPKDANNLLTLNFDADKQYNILGEEVVGQPE